MLIYSNNILSKVYYSASLTLSITILINKCNVLTTYFFFHIGLIGRNNGKDSNKEYVDDVEDAIQKTGGVSCFQYLSFLIIVSGMVAGAFILYCLAYFERIPSKLLC